MNTLQNMVLESGLQKRVVSGNYIRTSESNTEYRGIQYYIYSFELNYNALHRGRVLDLIKNNRPGGGAKIAQVW